MLVISSSIKAKIHGEKSDTVSSMGKMERKSSLMTVDSMKIKLNAPLSESCRSETELACKVHLP